MSAVQEFASAQASGSSSPGLDGLQTIFNPQTLTRKGLCPVTAIKGQHGQGSPAESHSLYFEQHGTGPEKVLFIMGLNSSSFAWAAQVDYFGRSEEYSVVVFDNRGVGNSGTPRGPYSTSGMAEDIIVLLDHVGWTDARDLHVVGLSMGGMIAQELASRIPERIVSLTLGVTTAGGYPWTNLPSWKGFKSLATIMTLKDKDQIISIVLEMVFPVAWLNAQVEDGRTNREVQREIYRRRHAVSRPQSLVGHVSQMIAALTHNCAPKRLQRIAKSIPKVTIVTGDDDNLVDPANSIYLASQMPEAHFDRWEGTGHALHGQWPERFNKLLEDTFREGRQRVWDGWMSRV